MQVAPRMHLPTSRSIDSARVELLGRGFTLVDTPPSFDDGLFRRLKRSKTVLPFHSKRWWNYPQLARYGCWLEEFLRAALPEESVSLAALEFRHEPAGCTRTARTSARCSRRTARRRSTAMATPCTQFRTVKRC